jgi:hypothetical protein
MGHWGSRFFDGAVAPGAQSHRGQPGSMAGVLAGDPGSGLATGGNLGNSSRGPPHSQGSAEERGVAVATGSK